MIVYEFTIYVNNKIYKNSKKRGNSSPRLKAGATLPLFLCNIYRTNRQYNSIFERKYSIKKFIKYFN